MPCLVSVDFGGEDESGLLTRGAGLRWNEKTERSTSDSALQRLDMNDDPHVDGGFPPSLPSQSLLTPDSDLTESFRSFRDEALMDASSADKLTGIIGDCHPLRLGSQFSTLEGLKDRAGPPHADDTVQINVGGQIFETCRSTLLSMGNTKLSDAEEMERYYRPERRDYFFDRDPEVFRIILNYLRTRELHVPTCMCGPSIKREFEFWGIDELDIERCCWTHYNTWNTQSKSLEKLESFRKTSLPQVCLSSNVRQATCWNRYRAKIWSFINDPTSSKWAQMYAWMSVMFVVLSIFAFCAETHPFFEVPFQEVRTSSVLYRYFTVSNARKVKESMLAAKMNSSDGATSDEIFVEHPAIIVIDLICLFYFSVEYAVRLLFSPTKRKFLLSLQNIIDFLAVLPDYVQMIIIQVSPLQHTRASFVDFMFIIRVTRLFRIFRLIRHVPGLWILFYTLKASFNELLLMSVFLVIGMVIFSSLMYFAENKKGFSNIPIGFWWSVVTMTTVGYGDMYPKSSYGYIIGSLCAISGLLMIAFTVPIIVSNFVLYYTHVQYGLAKKERCRRPKHFRRPGSGQRNREGQPADQHL